MKISTKGIIIKTMDFNEDDLLITIFSLKRGKIVAIARNAKKVKSKFAPVSNLFVYGEFDVYIGKNWNHLNDISINRSFYSIREDIEKMSYGSYFLELTLSSIYSNRPDRKNFILLLKTLAFLEETTDYNLLKVIFDYKFISNLGYNPNIYDCSNCKKSLENNIKFSVKNGGMLCNNCDFNDSMNISKKILKIFQYIDANKIEDIIKIEINSVFLKKLDIILYKYISYYLEKSDFKSLKFIKLFKEEK